MAQYKTIGFVVRRAVELAQLDSSFLTLARQYYNLTVHSTVTDFDWLYYRVEAPDTNLLVGQYAYDLPTDYSRSDTCYLIDSSGNTRPITITNKYKFDRLKTHNIDGDPTLAYIDLGSKKIVFNASTSSGRKFRLTYFRIPDAIDESGGDDSNEIDFEDPMYLVYSIASMLMDYTDDERAALFQQKADAILRNVKMNQADEDNDPRLDLGPSFRPGRRSNNGGGWSGWGIN